jgi:hypothetical protein
MFHLRTPLLLLAACASALPLLAQGEGAVRINQIQIIIVTIPALHPALPGSGSKRAQKYLPASITAIPR